MPDPVTPTGETAGQVTPEPSVAPQAPGSVTPEPVNEPAKVDPPKAEDVDSLRKQLQKLEQENNLNKNKLSKFDKDREDARQAELTEVQRLQEEVNEYRADKSQREANEFRKEVLADYLSDSPAALKAAQALIAKNPLNLAWGEGLTQDEAKAELIGQLDALKEVVGEVATPTAPDAPTPPAHANNPSLREPEPTQLDDVAQARKSGDFSKLIGKLSSVQFQNKRD